MRSILPWLLSTTLVFAAHAQAPAAPDASLAAGVWRADMVLKGAPGGDKTASAQWCWKEPIAPEQREQAVLDALAANAKTNDDKPAPKCSAAAIAQTGSASRWQASCPVGPATLKGSGSGRFDANSATLEQQLKASVLLMKLDVTQTIQLKRLGDC